MSNNHELYVKQAIALAQAAREHGNHPFGALLVRENRVVLTAENSVMSSRDVTHHAELNLVSQASRQFSAQEMAEMTLYTSTEPCAMCAGAIYWAGMRTVVFGCSAETLGRLAGGSLVIPCTTIFAHGAQPTQVIGPILEHEAEKVHHGFWP